MLNGHKRIMINDNGNYGLRIVPGAFAKAARPLVALRGTGVAAIARASFNDDSLSQKKSKESF